MRRLHRSGLHYHIEEVARGLEALDCVARRRYDCVVLDYRLPDTDAITLLPDLRMRSMERDLAVVMLTGTGNDRVAVQAIKLGVHDYLHKSNPDAALLRQAIEHAVLGSDRQRFAREQTEKLEQLVLHDPLTGLANRLLFSEGLEHSIGVAERAGTSFALIVMDLDRFKEVNDSLGHSAGDRVLAAIAPLLDRKLRRTDTLVRIGGDEFAAVLPGTESIDGALLAAEKLIAAVATPVSLGDAIVTVGLSAGVAMYPAHGTTAETLLANADLAMYEAKRSGCGVAVYHAPGRSAMRAELINSRTAALTSGDELVLHYQPQIDLLTGAVRGIEALVRWQHPELGLLLPMEFIPAAERSNAIRSISYAILDKALDQAVAWAAAGTPTSVAVNLSVRMLDDPELSSRVLAALALRSLAPSTLTLK
ncbi:MAG: GGDEF domain-containing response regulator [Betaproteobacteria bacterium]|nr:GGDEF domain-containing response regulator [Betaproteobacteria bacterium]